MSEALSLPNRTNNFLTKKQWEAFFKVVYVFGFQFWEIEHVKYDRERYDVYFDFRCCASVDAFEFRSGVSKILMVGRHFD